MFTAAAITIFFRDRERRRAHLRTFVPVSRFLRRRRVVFLARMCTRARCYRFSRGSVVFLARRAVERSLVP